MEPAFGTNHVKNIGGQVKYSTTAGTLPQTIEVSNEGETAFQKVPPAKKKPAKKATAKKTKARR